MAGDRFSDFNLETVRDIADCLRRYLANNDSPELIGGFINELGRQNFVIKMIKEGHHPELNEIISIGEGLAQRKNLRHTEIDALNRLNVLIFILDPSAE